jgi:short-subunit dehydrogenase
MGQTRPLPAANGPLAGRRVLLTGASSGIGLAVASQLVAHGCDLLVTARRADRLQSLVDLAASTSPTSPPAVVTACPGDLAQSEHIARLVALADQRWGSLDLLVHAAGAGAIGPFAEASPQRLRQIMELDFFAPVELCRQALPLLRRGRQPAVLLVGSVLAYRGVPRKSEYCAAKFALRGWAEAVRTEWHSEGIELLEVHPSTTRTEFFDALLETGADQTSTSLGSMSAEAVGRRIIDQLIRRRPRSVLSLGGKSLVWSAQRFPRCVDWLLRRSEQRTSTPSSQPTHSRPHR